MRRALPAAVAAALVLVSCGEPVKMPTSPELSAPSSAVAGRATATDSITASARWNALTRAIVGRRTPNANFSGRTFALVSVAQYNAVIATDSAKTRGLHPSAAGAAAGASAAVLAGLYPMEMVAINEQLASDVAYFGALSSSRDESFGAGVTVGRGIAAEVLAFAAHDGSAAVWSGSLRLPPGPDVWYPAAGTQPATPLWGDMTPWTLASGSQFRSVPPPVYGGPEFLLALAEVQQYSAMSPLDPARIEQLRLATFWQTGYGPGAVAGYFGAWTAARVTQLHFDERRAARALALVHMAIMDASIGCYDSKYYYLYPRPWQADASILTPVGRPNFPSYPSGHSCGTASAVGVLSALFPSQADELRPLVAEAGMSRIYGGLHYIFDVTAGQALGYGVAGQVLANAPNGHEPIPLP